MSLDWALIDWLSKAFSARAPLAIIERSFGSVRVYQRIDGKKPMHDVNSNGLVQSANYQML